MDGWDNKELMAALRQASEELGGEGTLDELLERAPSVTVTVRLPALELMCAQTFAGSAGITRNKLLARLIGSAMAEMVRTKVVPGWGEGEPPIDLTKGQTAETASWDDDDQEAA
jgi:hypothetical protein